MMNEKLDWTNQLGEAFLTQPNDIQNAVQALRKQAEATGNLKSSKEQKVSRIAAPPSTGYAGPPEYIVIEPVEPDYIYVPVYDPVVVYGADYWPPAYVPFFWHPPWWTVGPAFGFGAALFVGPALWYHYNWGHAGFAAIQTNTALYSRFNRGVTLPVPASFRTGSSTRRTTATSNSRIQIFNSSSEMLVARTFRASRVPGRSKASRAHRVFRVSRATKAYRACRRAKASRTFRVARVSRTTKASRESRPTKTLRAFRPATRTFRRAEARVRAPGWSAASKFMRSVPAVLGSAPGSREGAASRRRKAALTRCAAEFWRMHEARAHARAF